MGGEAWTISGEFPKLGNGVQMIVTQGNCEVKDEVYVTYEPRINNCGSRLARAASQRANTFLEFQEGPGWGRACVLCAQDLRGQPTGRAGNRQDQEQDDMF